MIAYRQDARRLYGILRLLAFSHRELAMKQISVWPQMYTDSHG
jgi:hypothetical protein